MHDIPIIELEQTILNVTNGQKAYMEKFDYVVQYTKHKSQLAQNYDKVVQLQTKLDTLHQSLQTDPLIIQLQNEKWCIQAMTKAIRNCRPVYLNEYQTQYQNIVTQLKKMYDSFNQHQLTKKFSVSVFEKQVEFHKNLNYSTAHRWINNTFESLQSATTNAGNQSKQLMFDNGTLVHDYDGLTLFGIQLYDTVQNSIQTLQQINNKIESISTVAKIELQNVETKLQTSIQKLTQACPSFLDNVDYTLVHRHFRAMQLTSRRQKIRTLILKLECTAFEYNIIRAYDANIHKISPVSPTKSFFVKLFETNILLFNNGMNHELKSIVSAMLIQTFDNNIGKKVESINQQSTNMQAWKKDVLKSMERKTALLFQELFSDENCKLLTEVRFFFWLGFTKPGCKNRFQLLIVTCCGNNVITLNTFKCI